MMESVVSSVLSLFHDIGLYDEFDLTFGSGVYCTSIDLISVLSFGVLSLCVCLLFRWMYLRIRHL